MLTSDQLVFSRYGIKPEELLWSGRPYAGLRLRTTDALQIPFSLMWCGFAIFWETMVLRGGAPFFFALWGIPFVAAGLYFVAGRFFWDAYRRSVTYYGLTNDAALIVRTALGGGVERIYLPAVTGLNLQLSADGSGTILFAQLPQLGPFTSSWRDWSGKPAVPAFEYVPDAQRVFDLCTQAQRRPA